MSSRIEAEQETRIHPFLRVATPEMLDGVKNLHEHVEERRGEVDTGFSAEAFRFCQAANKASEEMRKR